MKERLDSVRKAREENKEKNRLYFSKPKEGKSRIVSFVNDPLNSFTTAKDDSDSSFVTAINDNPFSSYPTDSAEEKRLEKNRKQREYYHNNKRTTSPSQKEDFSTPPIEQKAKFGSAIPKKKPKSEEIERLTGKLY